MRDRLLELAQRAPIFLSQDNQTYVNIPTATPVYSEDFFTWFINVAENRLGCIPTPSEVGRVVRTLDSQARTCNNQRDVHHRIAKIGPKNYQLDLGTFDMQMVNITGQHWENLQYFDARFERFEDHIEMTAPVVTANTLAACMEAQFKVDPINADKLALWVAEALLPDQQPPMLVITGKAREAAVEKLRSLIDPVIEPIIETPLQFTELYRMALENQVLAFSVSGPLSEKVKKTLNDLHQGTRLRLKYCNRSRFKLRGNIQRPVLIATAEPQEISPHQINIEINEAIDFDFGKIVGALLNLLVVIIGQPVVQRETQVMAEPSMQPGVLEVADLDSS